MGSFDYIHQKLYIIDDGMQNCIRKFSKIKYECHFHFESNSDEFKFQNQIGKNSGGSFSNGSQKLVIRPRDQTFFLNDSITDNQKLSKSFGALN